MPTGGRPVPMPNTCASPMTMKAMIAATLISANQYSNEPKLATDLQFT